MAVWYLSPQTAPGHDLADSFMGASSFDKPKVDFYPSLSVAQGSTIHKVELRGSMDLASASSVPLHLDCEARNLPRGFDTLTYPGRHEAVASIGGLHASVVEDRSPLLAAAFETSRSGKRLHLDTLSPHTAIAFVRYLYTGSYAVSGDWEDVPTSLLLHCKMYHIGHIYDLDLKQQAYVNILRQCEFGCSSPEKPVELCEAIDFAYSELFDREPVTDAIVQYCVSRCLSHQLHQSFEFKRLAYNVRAFHQDLTKVCRDRGYEDESASVIIQLPYKNFAPAKYASSEEPGFEDLVHHFHGSDRFDDMATSKKRHLAAASDTSASPVKHQRVNVSSNSSMKDLAFRQATTQPNFVFSASKKPASHNFSLPIRQRDVSSTEMLRIQQNQSDASSGHFDENSGKLQAESDAAPDHLKPYISKAPDVLDVIKHAKKKAAEMKLIEMANKAAKPRDAFVIGAPPRHDGDEFMNPFAKAAFKLRQEPSAKSPERNMPRHDGDEFTNPFAKAAFKLRQEPSAKTPELDMPSPIPRFALGVSELKREPFPAYTEPVLDKTVSLPVKREIYSEQEQHDQSESFVGLQREKIRKSMREDAEKKLVELKSAMKEPKQMEDGQKEAEQTLADLAEQRAAKRNAAREVVPAEAPTSAAPHAPIYPNKQTARESMPVAPKLSPDDAVKSIANDDSDADSWVEVSPEPAAKNQDVAIGSSPASDSDWEFC